MKRLLVDENVPRQLAPLFSDLCQVDVIHDTPWAGMKNGELVQAINGQIDLLLTCDSNLKYQQNVAKLRFGIVVLRGRTNRLDDLLPLVGSARHAIAKVSAGEIIEVTR